MKLALLLKTLILWVYAYRYFHGAWAAKKRGIPFVYRPWDSMLVSGRVARPRTLIVLGIFCAIAPIAISLYVSLDDLRNLAFRLRNPCKSLLLESEARRIFGETKARFSASRFGCEAWFETPDEKATLGTIVLDSMGHGIATSRADNEAHGARVTPFAFGEGAILSVPRASRDEIARGRQAAIDGTAKEVDRVLAGRRPTGRYAIDTLFANLPFDGAEIVAVRCGVQIRIRVHGDNDDEARVRAVADMMKPRLNEVCRYER